MRNYVFILSVALLPIACKNKEAAVEKTELPQTNNEPRLIIQSPQDMVRDPYEDARLQARLERLKARKDSARAHGGKAPEGEAGTTGQKAINDSPVRDQWGQPVQKPEFPDSLFFRMQKTPCYGECPIYTVNIYKSGRAVYEGKNFVENIGMYETRFSEQEMKQLVSLAKDADYFQLEHVYDAAVTDLPSTSTVLNTAQGTHWIMNRMDAPAELVKMEQQIEALVNRKNWVLITPVDEN